MQINILGPVELISDGHVVQLGGPGQRTLLAALALDHGRVLAVNHLIDVLWHSDPPATARSKIHAHVSALRKAIAQPTRSGTGPLLTATGGYALATETARVDLTAFEVLRAEAKAAAVAGHRAAEAELLGAALALWRGPVCADLRAPAVRARAAALEERRTLTLEAKAEADLAIGRYESVVAELSAGLIVRPLRERMRALLMIGLCQLGCRTEALNLYLDGRQIMIAELGLEPSPPLRDLHRRMLSGDSLLQPKPITSELA